MKFNISMVRRFFSVLLVKRKLLLIIVVFFFLRIDGMESSVLAKCECSPDNFGTRLSLALEEEDKDAIKSLFDLPNSVSTMEYLLLHEKLLPNARGMYADHTLTHWAVRYSNHSILELVLGHRATNPNAKNRYGSCALGFAVAQGNVRSTQLLLRHPYIDPNANYIPAAGKFDGDHQTVLHVAIIRYWVMGTSSIDAYRKIIQLFLSNEKTDLNKVDSSGKTALHYAVGFGNLRMITLLWAHKKKIDLSIQDSEGKTVLDCARQLNNKEAISLLEFEMLPPNS